MKKFNGFENYMIIEALKLYISTQESEIIQMEEKGMRSIFAQGYWEMVGKEVMDKVHNMTLKKK